MVSLSSHTDVDLRQLFTQVGSHRGTLVAIKHINRKSVDLTRTLRKELKLVSQSAAAAAAAESSILLLSAL